MFNKTLKIGRKSIGPGKPTYIIAEAGSNHNGELKKAKDLIDIAAETGADAVKFQSVSFDTLTSDHTNHLLKKAVDAITLDRDWYRELKTHCDKKQIEFLSTPTYETAVDELVEAGVNAFKIASMDLTNIPFIRYVAKTGLPIILSRGMSLIGEIDQALQAIAGQNNPNVALLHCIANYPTRPEDVHLNSLKTLATAFDVPVGFSDHTESESIAAAAVAMGANVIEKHFTYDRSIEGFDHFYALEPKALERMIQGIRQVEKAMGQARVDVFASETQAKRDYQRSITVKKPVRAGETFTQENLTCKRPATGLSPLYWDVVIGQTAASDLDPNHVLTNKDIITS